MGLSALEKRRLRENLIALSSFRSRKRGEGGAEFFSVGSSDRICGNASKPHSGSSGGHKPDLPLQREGLYPPGPHPAVHIVQMEQRRLKSSVKSSSSED